MKLAKILLAASIGLALTFTLSCSSDDGGEGNSQSYSYCLKSETCLSGPFTLNDCNSLGGLPSNSCSYGGVEPGIRCTALDNTETHYCSEGTMKKYGFVTDDGGQTYKSVVIGKQTWMAENLNYDASGSKCYDNDPDNCTKYGRLYDWNTALTVCPSGWHLPSDEEWNYLLVYVGGFATAGNKLEATNGKSSNGIDNYGFSALLYVYDDNCWWSATEDNASDKACQYQISIGIHGNYMDRGCYGKSSLNSVRCLQD